MPVKNKMKKALIVSDIVEVRSIRLIKLDSEIDENYDMSTMENCYISFDYDTSFVPPENNQLHCFVDFYLRVKDHENEDAENKIKLDAIFQLSYMIPENVKLKQAEIESFSDINAVFNAWPYCRELVQTQLARMGCPPIIIPLFRLKKSAK